MNGEKGKVIIDEIVAVMTASLNWLGYHPKPKSKKIPNGVEAPICKSD